MHRKWAETLLNSLDKHPRTINATRDADDAIVSLASSSLSDVLYQGCEGVTLDDHIWLNILRRFGKKGCAKTTNSIGVKCNFING